MNFPKQIQDLIEALERLPGVGPKTAERLTFYLLHVPKTELEKFSSAILGISSGIVLCKICKNIAGTEICPIDQDESRDKTLLCVVEMPFDVFSLEKTGAYRGIYHVLHGLINPINNIGPDELYINDLVDRVKSEPQIKEIILALNPTMEGEATALYLKKKIEEIRSDLTLTRLGVGLPIGGDLQYADEATLTRALSGRKSA